MIWNAESISVVDHFERDGYFHTPPVLVEKLSEGLNLRLLGGSEGLSRLSRILR
jgi:hypothetical protein